MSQLAMRKIPLSKLSSEIAKYLALKYQKKTGAYKIITENGFHLLVGLGVQPKTSLVFSVEYYIQGLYVPYHLIDLSLSDWIGRWERADLSTVLPVIKYCYEHFPCDSIATIVDLLNNYKLHYWGSIINRYELLSCSYLVIDRYDEAREYLNRMVAFENDQNAEWFVEHVKRAKMLLDLMDKGKRKEIREQLLSWQRYTMTELKLPEQ